MQSEQKDNNGTRASSDVFSKSGFQRIDKAVNQSVKIVKDAMAGKRDVLPTKWQSYE